MVFGFTSCKNNTSISVKKPVHFIEKEKMVDILYDMAIVSAAKGVNRRLMERNGVMPDQYIYEKHKIDSVIFLENNAYYAHNITSYEAMYDLVRLRIEKMRDSFNVKISNDKVLKDSLSKKVRREQDSLRKINKGKPKRKLISPELMSKSQRKRVDTSVQLKRQEP